MKLWLVDFTWGNGRIADRFGGVKQLLEHPGEGRGESEQDSPASSRRIPSFHQPAAHHGDQVCAEPRTGPRPRQDLTLSGAACASPQALRHVGVPGLHRRVFASSARVTRDTAPTVAAYWLHRTVFHVGGSTCAEWPDGHSRLNLSRRHHGRRATDSLRAGDQAAEGRPEHPGEPAYPRGSSAVMCGYADEGAGGAAAVRRSTDEPALPMTVTTRPDGWFGMMRRCP